MANYRRFGSNVSLTNLTHDVAGSIREAQAFGLGVRGSGTGAEAFDRSYGFYIGAPAEYRLYRDTNNNQTYQSTGSTPDELIRVYSLPNGANFSRRCTSLGGAYSNLASDTRLSIAFLRPNPDAIIKTVTSGGTVSTPSRTRICVRSREGEQKQIEILRSGQVTVLDDCSCPS